MKNKATHNRFIEEYIPDRGPRSNKILLIADAVSQ